MRPQLAVLVLCLFLLTGCMEGCETDMLSQFLLMGCDVQPDSAHCYQGAAVQGGDASLCEKIKQPAEFKSAGSNPPKDKCYLMVAQNTGDYDVCKNIVGGMYSYSQSECFTDVAVTKEDPSGCKKMTGADLAACNQKVGALMTPEKLTDLVGDIDDLKSQVGKNPDDADLKQQLADLEKKKKDMLGVMSPAAQADYLKKNREDILGEVDDEDVKSDIAKDFIKVKTANPTLTVDQLVQKLKAIKEEKEMIKRLDDQANTLVDQLKGTVGDYADEKKQEMIDAATEKGWDWMKKNGGEDLKWGLRNLEAAKDKYDKASEQYDKLNKQYEKIKKTYDEMKAVYDKVDKFNKMLAEGKIDQGQAKVLKGAVLLGKGLEYATSYVPVFGSTVSTITKETMDMTIKLATKRAERTNSINKCIDDPEHCDPSGITAY